MNDSVELVMTVPEPHGNQHIYQVSSRSTLGTLVQLIAQAQHRIIISAPYIHTGQNGINKIVFNSLNYALARKINIDFLSTKSCMNYIAQNQLLPISNKNLRLFQAAANAENEQMIGSHAKFCVADGNSAYVGSANLTDPGLNSQFELGLLVNGQIAHQIEQFWDYSVNLGLFIMMDINER